mgnify:CR=1 FL=1
MLEKNQEDVSVKYSQRAPFDCVVYDTKTVEDELLSFIKLVVIINKFYVYAKIHPVIPWVQFRGNMSMHSLKWITEDLVVLFDESKQNDVMEYHGAASIR